MYSNIYIYTIERERERSLLFVCALLCVVSRKYICGSWCRFHAERRCFASGGHTETKIYCVGARVCLCVCVVAYIFKYILHKHTCLQMYTYICRYIYIYIYIYMGCMHVCWWQCHLKGCLSICLSEMAQETLYVYIYICIYINTYIYSPYVAYTYIEM